MVDRDWIWIHPAQPTMKAVAEAVCARHGLEVDDIRGPSRLSYVARARQEFMFECRKTARKSMGQIAQFLNRDHTTVVYGIQRHQKRAAA